ncbi:hypothetical protein AVEN_266885-1 [Araneus ventricosus]|uniref:Reverse transcriptase domain-containing protein n=1 Tax=Araneus ventricosus TaxID=182803 RepID=A0A4Y2I1W7_ARAVE|nr:hypothetical protein AVEN_266885-1 [Araneus ventricosus]
MDDAATAEVTDIEADLASRIWRSANQFQIKSNNRQAFLQICLAGKHKDVVWFLWTRSNPRVGKRPVLEVYRCNRVIFGVNARPFLLTATAEHHIGKYMEDYPMAVQHLDSFIYVDGWITGQDTREEALLISRCAKNIIKEAGMVMRKWISNDSTLISQWNGRRFRHLSS